jgi:hypothetical protein
VPQWSKESTTLLPTATSVTPVPVAAHHAGALVTQDQRRLRHEPVDAWEQIGVAEPCGGYLDEYLARAGLGELDVLDLEGATAFAQYCSLDMHPNS